jgi:hypothetical protein
LEGNDDDARVSGGCSAAITLWQQFTDYPDPWKLKSFVCQHCCIIYHHHNKVELAMVHLNACHTFCKAINSIEKN